MIFRAALQAVLLLVATGLFAAQGGETAASPKPDRSPSSDGATVGFSNLADGDVLPLSYTAKFTVSGMGIAPAGVEIDNTGHFFLLIDVAKAPDYSQPLQSNDNFIQFGQGQSEAELELAEGEHSLQLLLADYRQVPHDPPVMSEVIHVVVSADAPPPGTDKD